MPIMPNYRTAFWLTGLLGLLLLPSALWGQQTPQNYDDVYSNGNAPYSNAYPAEHAALTPFAPVGFKPNWKLFAPVDTSDYGNGVKPRVGYFFSYERVYFSTSRAATTTVGATNATEGDNLNFLNVITSPITAPITGPQQTSFGNTTFNAPAGTYPYFPTATVANPAFPNANPVSPVFFEAGQQQISIPFSDLTPQNIVGGNYNSNTTAALTSRFGTGNRWEFGYMDVNDTGWLVSILDHISTGQNVTLQGGTVLFNDPTGFLQGFQTSLSGPYDADLNGNHIYGRNGYDIPTQTPPTVTIVTEPPPLPPIILSTPTIYTYPGTPSSPAPGDYGIYFPQLTLLNGKAVPAGTPGATTYFQAGGDEVVYTPTFTALQISDKVTTTGVETMRLYRTPQLHSGGTIDLMLGARYLQLNDVFQVYGTGGGFDAMEITQKVLNNVVGPQIGARYAHQRGRWSVFSEGRFFPSANFAVERNSSVLASNAQAITTANQLPTTTTTSTTSSSSGSGGSTGSPQGPLIVVRDKPSALVNGGLTSTAGLNNLQFAPATEFRAGVNCWLTQGVSAKCSYTGIFLPNMTRATNTINYTLPNLGIINGGHHQCVFINGFTFGIEINR